MTDVASLPWGFEPDHGPNIVGGRYELPGPDGKVGKYTRVTTFANELSNEYALNHWKLRVVARGIGLRPDLAARANAAQVDDKKAYAEIIPAALEAGGAGVKANEGTALHGFVGGLVAGTVTWEQIPVDYRADVAAFFEELKRQRLQQIVELSERTVRNDEFGTGGTFDLGLYEEGSGCLVMADLKSGAKLEYSELEFAIQFSQYAHAKSMRDNQTGQMVPAPEWRTDYALVIHVPRGSGQCFIHRVDLNIGYAASRVVAQSRALKALPVGTIITPYHPAEASLLKNNPQAPQSKPAPVQSSYVPPPAPIEDEVFAGIPNSGYDKGGWLEPGETMNLPGSTEHVVAPSTVAFLHATEDPAPEIGTHGGVITETFVSESEIKPVAVEVPAAPASLDDQAAELLELLGTKDAKAKAQTLAKRVGDDIKLNAYTKNIAAAIVRHLNWPAVRDDILSELRAEASERKTRGKKSAAVIEEPAEPEVPAPTQDEVDSVLGLSPQATRITEDIERVKAGEIIVPPPVATELPEASFFGKPLSARDKTWYEEAMTRTTGLQGIFDLATEAATRKVAYDPIVLYRCWIEQADTQALIEAAGAHAKSSGIALPAGLVGEAQQKWARVPVGG
jgi:hypothetical protein